MRFSVASLALMAVSAVAAPGAQPDADPWCYRTGEACYKNKRAALPDASPEADPWCYRVGAACYKTKREAAALAAPDASPDADPWCNRPGSSCYKAKRAAEAFAEAIQTSPNGMVARSPQAQFSNLPGGAAYMVKRSMNDMARLIAFSQADPKAFYSQLQNHLEAEENGTEVTAPEKREADASPADADKRWCYRLGGSCWKAKRAAEAVLASIRSDTDDAEYIQKREAEPWCYRVGSNCWKSKRDVASIERIARSIIDSGA